MAKHHPDLIMCRKQPGIGEYSILCMSLLLHACGKTKCSYQLFESNFLMMLQPSGACAKNVSEPADACDFL